MEAPRMEDQSFLINAYSCKETQADEKDSNTSKQVIEY